jgi:hypothetical protein
MLAHWLLECMAWARTPCTVWLRIVCTLMTVVGLSVHLYLWIVCTVYCTPVAEPVYLWLRTVRLPIVEDCVFTCCWKVYIHLSPRTVCIPYLRTVCIPLSENCLHTFIWDWPPGCNSRSPQGQGEGRSTGRPASCLPSVQAMVDTPHVYALWSCLEP